MADVFVFGSNLAGRHGKGAALFAKQHFGAIYGQGIGRQGNSYAIPTKDANLKPLKLEEIYAHVQDFIDYARTNYWESFSVTPIGCGLAGYSTIQIAPMFKNVSENVNLPQDFREILASKC